MTSPSASTAAAPTDPDPVPHVPLSAAMKAANLTAVVGPLVGTMWAIILLWGWGVGWVEVGLLLGMYAVTMLGITVGYHRLFSHRAYETGRVVQFLLAGVGSMAAQGPLFQWVATHRRHHQYSDGPDDPHSPHHSGGGVLGQVRGAWFAHVGWMFTPVPADMERYVPDLRRHRHLRVAHAIFPAWVVGGLVIPAVVGGLASGAWAGALLGLLWGGVVRIFLVHHITWSVNSVCHLWGSRPHTGGDHSRNNPVFGVLAMGEGWHNNHHAFPASARHGFGWQLDLSYCVIRAMAAVGLAWKLRLPASHRGDG